MVDDALVQDAFSLTGARTRRELVHRAPEELSRRRRKLDLTDLAGNIRLRDDFNLKSMRAGDASST